MVVRSAGNSALKPLPKSSLGESSASAPQSLTRYDACRSRSPLCAHDNLTMLVAVTVLFATVSFVLYRSSPWLKSLPSCLKLPYLGPETNNQSRKDIAPTLADSHISEERAPTAGSVSEKSRNDDQRAYAETSSTSSRHLPPTVVVQDSDEYKVNKQSRSEYDDNDTYLPSFPAINSAQRAPQIHTNSGPPWSAKRDAQLMPPPLPPPQAPRIINSTSTATVNRTSQLAASAQRARAGDANASPQNLKSEFITNTNANAVSKSRPNSNSKILMPPPPPVPTLTHSLQQSQPSNTALKPTTNPRKKIILKPGRSPLDWANLSRSGQNLSGVPTLQRVRPSILKHNNGRKGRPAWSSYHGKVYNVTPFLPYHPGGEGELMRAAGKDGGKLFMDAHPWVSWENMLEGCLVGILVSENDGVSAEAAVGDGDPDQADNGLDDID